MSRPAVVALLWLASLVATGLWREHVGHTAGVAEQKVADQRLFDQINREREQQRAEADALYRAEQEKTIAALVERDAFKHQLEVTDAENRKATAALAAKYSGMGLRFRAVEGSGAGQNCRGPAPAEGNAPGPDAASVVQLPDALAGSLRRIVADADALKDEYAKCYAYVMH